VRDLFSNNSKRVFIAIEFEENIKRYLHDIQNRVVQVSEKGNFTSKENFHLTLNFIGEVNIDKIENINKCIYDVAINQSKFKLYFDTLGQFPRGNKSIVWVGLKSNEMLNKIYQDLGI
jgi:2'-5' RNA ligase